MIETLTAAVTLIGFLAFMILLVLGAAAMARRITLYIRTNHRVPVILRRDFGLFAAFLIVFGEGAVLRFAGVTLEEGSLERLLFLIQQNVIAIVALGYWVKVELFDVDDPTRE